MANLLKLRKQAAFWRNNTAVRSAIIIFVDATTSTSNDQQLGEQIREFSNELKTLLDE